MVGYLFSFIGRRGQILLVTALLVASATAGPQGPVAAGDATVSPARSSQDATIRITGRVEQTTRLPAPQDGMLEVFVRLSDGTLVVAIVPEAHAQAIVVDTTVDFAGHPDGTQTYRSRDGQSRTVPRVRAMDTPVAVAGGVDDLSVMLGVLVLLMAGFGVLSLVIARGRAKPLRMLDDEADADCTAPTVAAGSELPDDPAEAMAELARRSEDSDP